MAEQLNNSSESTDLTKPRSPYSARKTSKCFLCNKHATLHVTVGLLRNLACLRQRKSNAREAGREAYECRGNHEISQQ